MKVKRFLDVLFADEKCTTKKTTKGIVITIENYDFYQDVAPTKKPENEPQKSHKKATNEPQKSHKKAEKNKVNKVNKVNNDRERGLRPCGPGGRLSLTEGELSKFQAEFPQDAERFMVELSEYLEASGKDYKNHYYALRRWAKNDGRFGPKEKAGKTGLDKIAEEIDNGTFTF